MVTSLTPKPVVIDRKLILVDNRIVVGKSSWMPGERMEVIAILHPKQNKPHHRAAVKALIDQFNTMLDERGEKIAAEPAIHIAR